VVKGILKQIKCFGSGPISKGGKFCGVGLWNKSSAGEEGEKVVVKDFNSYNAFSLKRQCP